MESTFTGIEIGKRALVANTEALDTVGHNLSNASTDGYSRQRVVLTPFDPLYMPGLNREETPGQLGQGVTVEQVQRIHDQILEGTIVAKSNEQGYWQARDKYILMVEQTYNEPTDNSVRTLMDKFWQSWQELSLSPSQLATRQAVLQRGEALVDGIHNRYNSLKDIRDMIEQDTTATVDQVNSLLQNIADLNNQIVKVKATGDNPNDLMDRRDLLVKQLSGLVNITVDNRDPDEFQIHTGGLELIQGRIVHKLAAVPDPNNDGYAKITWADTGETARFTGGKLAALVQLRDGDVRGEMQKLDTMTINFIDLVNEIHRSGAGLGGSTGMDFFSEHPFITNVAGNYDQNGDGTYDHSYIFRVTGNNTLDPQQQVGLSGTIQLSGPTGNISIDYHPTDTVGDIIKRINTSGAEVVARLDRNGRLELKATPAANSANPDFVIRHIQDSGQFLVGYAGILQGSGAAGAYNWDHANAVLSFQGGNLRYAVAPLAHPADWVEVNKALIQNPNDIAAGFASSDGTALSGDGRAALAIARLRNSQVMIGKTTSFDEYFSDTVADIGLKGEVANRSLNTQNAVMKQLDDLRASVSGVNIDEELTNMIKFQHGYNAAARFVTEVNTMLDTLINQMGV